MRYRALDITVNDLCESIGDHQHKRYVDVMKVVVKKLERFNIFHDSPYYRSTNLRVSNNYTATLPNDCVKPIKVGVCINGHIASFYYNDELCTPSADAACSCPPEAPTEHSVDFGNPSAGYSLCSFCSFPNYYGNNQQPLEYTNYTSRPYQTRVGWFKFEYDKDRIVFDPKSNIEPDSEIVLTYKSSMQKINGGIVVPLECWEMLDYAVQAKFGDARLKQWNTSKSETEEQALVRLYNKMTPEEWEAAISGYKYLGIKR
jgi:hypothetical protein